MRILIANVNRNLVGGVEKYLQTLIPGLLAHGHETALLHENGYDPDAEGVDPAGLPVWRAEENSSGGLPDGVVKWKPSVVYSHGLERAGLEGALLDSYPTVLYGHNYFGTCVSGRKCHSFPRIQSCERPFGPACLALYFPRRCGGMHPGTAWHLYQRQSQLHSRLQQFQAVLAASRHMQREFQNNGVSRDKLHLVPLPVQVNSPASGFPSDRGHRRDRILFVGRLTDLKGADHLVQAVPKAAQRLGRPLTLTIAGDGPERSRLEKLAQGMEPAVEFAGWAKTSRKLDLMRQSDLLAVPSLWPEPFGLVGTEAACLGLPAVGYAVGGIPDWLISGQTGELAPGDPPTVQGLADAIVRALEDADHYSALCRGAWELSREFTLERHLAQLEPILDAAESGKFAARYEAAGLTV